MGKARRLHSNSAEALGNGRDLQPAQRAFKETCSENAGGANGAAGALKARLALLPDVENVKPGSVF